MWFASAAFMTANIIANLRIELRIFVLLMCTRLLQVCLNVMIMHERSKLRLDLQQLEGNQLIPTQIELNDIRN